MEIRNYRKNEELFWNELYIAPVLDDCGTITHFIGVQNDVSKRKKAEAELKEEKAKPEEKIMQRTRQLQENEAFLLSINETVRESLLVLDADFKVLSANKYFLHTFKVSLEDTVGQLLFELGNYQWSIPSMKELIVKILPTNNPVIDFQVQHDFPHIGKKIMLLNAYRVEFEGQYKDRILLAIEDITDKIEIDRRKDDFLSVASHELKTPLTTIKGLIQLLQRMPPENSSDKYLGTLHKVGKYVDRLNNLITELLDTSKIQSGKIELHKESFQIEKTVRDTVENFTVATPGYEMIIVGSTSATILGGELQIS